MSAIKYILKTPWKVKKNDWCEYHALADMARAARGHMAACRDNITHNFGAVMSMEEKMYLQKADYCIRDYTVMTSVASTDGPCSMEPVPCQIRCPHFIETSMCAHTCPNKYKNHMYIRALWHYEELAAERKHFWRTKFQNAK